MHKHCGKLTTIFIVIFFIIQIKAYAIPNDSNNQDAKSNFSELLDGNNGNNNFSNKHANQKKTVVRIRSKSHKILAGVNHELECTVFNSAKKYNIYWIPGNGVENKIKKLMKKRRSSFFTVSDDETANIRVTSKYVINCASKSDEGNYTCVAISDENKYYTATTYIHVNHTSKQNCIKHGPVITEYVDGIVSTIGSNVTLKCGVKTNWPVTWMLTNDDFYRKPLIGDRFKIRDGILSIKSVVWNDLGSYTCISKTENGEIVNATTFLYPSLQQHTIVTSKV